MHTMTTNQTNVLMLWACNIMVLREGMLFTRCILSLSLSAAFSGALCLLLRWPQYYAGIMYSSLVLICTWLTIFLE